MLPLTPLLAEAVISMLSSISILGVYSVLKVPSLPMLPLFVDKLPLSAHSSMKSSETGCPFESLNLTVIAAVEPAIAGSVSLSASISTLAVLEA